MKRKRVIKMLTAAAIACCISVVQVYAEPNLEEQMEQEIERLQGEKKDKEKGIDSLKDRLAENFIKISELERELVAKGEEVIQAEADYKAAKEKEKKQYDDMKLRIKYLYESGDDSALEMILNAESMSDMLSKVQYNEKIHNYDRNMLNEYSGTVQKVGELKSSLEAEQRVLEKKQEEYKTQQEEFNRAITALRAEVKDLDSQIQEAIKIAEEERRRREEEERKAREEAERRAEEERRRIAALAAQNAARETYAFNCNGDMSAAEIVVQAAWSQIGVPYVWGGNTPYVGLDCSGLTKWCYAQAGIDIPRYSEDQRYAGTVVTEPLPGDICWSYGHVAIYIGDGQMIEAQQPGTTICVSAVRVIDYVRWW